MRSRRGFGILEVLIAITLAGLLVMGYMLFSQQSLKSAKRSSEMSSLARVMTAIEKDVMKDMPFIPPQANDDPTMDSAMFAPPGPTVPAGSPHPSGERCYDSTGSLLASCANWTTSRDVFIKAQYFKTRVRDQSLDPGSPLNRIPVSRVRFKIVYKVEGQVQQPMYFSRLLTEVIRY